MDMVAIQYTIRNNQDIMLPDPAFPRPLILLKCLSWDLSNQQNVALAYIRWIKEMLYLCRLGGFYAIVEIPVQFIGVSTIDDKSLKQIVSFQSQVLAAYLSQGTLKPFDYYTRLYNLLRSGCTFNLVIDDKDPTDHGTYVEHTRDAAYCSWQGNFKEIDKLFPFLKSMVVFITNLSVSKRKFKIVPEQIYFRREWIWKLYARIWSYLRNR